MKKTLFLFGLLLTPCLALAHTRQGYRTVDNQDQEIYFLQEELYQLRSRNALLQKGIYKRVQKIVRTMRKNTPSTLSKITSWTLKTLGCLIGLLFLTALGFWRYDPAAFFAKINTWFAIDLQGWLENTEKETKKEEEGSIVQGEKGRQGRQSRQGKNYVQSFVKECSNVIRMAIQQKTEEDEIDYTAIKKMLEVYCKSQRSKLKDRQDRKEIFQGLRKEFSQNNDSMISNMVQENNMNYELSSNSQPNDVVNMLTSLELELELEASVMLTTNEKVRKIRDILDKNVFFTTAKGTFIKKLENLVLDEEKNAKKIINRIAHDQEIIDLCLGGDINKFKSSSYDDLLKEFRFMSLKDKEVAIDIMIKKSYELEKNIDFIRNLENKKQLLENKLPTLRKKIHEMEEYNRDDFIRSLEENIGINNSMSEWNQCMIANSLKTYLDDTFDGTESNSKQSLYFSMYDTLGDFMNENSIWSELQDRSSPPIQENNDEDDGDDGDDGDDWN